MPEKTITSQRAAFRAVLLAILATQLFVGLWALFAPASFYDDFPFGRGWVATLPAYNEHLARDVGPLYLALAVPTAAAAWSLERRLTGIALGAWLVFATPHAIYHLFNLEPYGTGDAIANAAAVLTIVVVPALFLAMLATGRDQAPRPRPA